MTTDQRCQNQHAKILAGTCPWCQRQIVNGRPMRRRPLRGYNEQMKQLLRAKLFDRLELARVKELADSKLRYELRQFIIRLSASECPLLSGAEVKRLADEVVEEVFGD